MAQSLKTHCSNVEYSISNSSRLQMAIVASLASSKYLLVPLI
jgi:hypothetical protein